LEVGAGEMKRVETWVLVPRSVFTDGTAEGRFAVLADGETVEEIDFGLIGPED
jgi:hypothetical protein